MGKCQQGKSQKILRAAWLSTFTYRKAPFIFVKVSGGHESIAQFKWNTEALNAHLDETICKIRPNMPEKTPKRYMLILRAELDRETSDAQL